MAETNTKHFVGGRVSVVTPVFNGEEYIHTLLNSVLNQTWDDIEMIVSDDGSTDKTVEICESYREKFEKRGYSFRIVKGEHNSASKAVGRGLAYVSGEYLIWPDGDDEILPESVRLRAEYLMAHPEYKCVRSLSEYVDYKTGEPVRPLERTGKMDTRKLFWDLLFGKTYVCCGCYMLRSEEFFEIYPTGEIPVYPVGQNFQMLLPFMYKYECPTIQEVLYRVNRRADSHSACALNKEQEYKKYEAYESLIDELAGIIDITDLDELRRIEVWKLRRRLDIARRHRECKKERQAICGLVKLHDITLRDQIREMLRSYWHQVKKK